MSYLEMTEGIPDFSKAVISLWFRVPREAAINAATSSLPTQDVNFSIMQGILPLVTFGKQQQSNNYVPLYNPDIVVGGPPAPPFGQQVGWDLKSRTDVDPCLIGLSCDNSDGTFRVEINLRGTNKGSYQALGWFLTRLTFIGPGPPPATGSGIIGVTEGLYQTTIEDASHATNDAQAEYFHITNSVWRDPDHWHHLLLSFDVGGSCSIGPQPNTDCKLWYAIDDTNYSGAGNMGPYRNATDGLGPNDIMTANTYRESGWAAGEFPKLFNNNWVAAPQGGCTPGPLSGASFGLPASSRYVEGVFNVEMAEFQMWTGVTLDTGSEENRRAFVDQDGKPVVPVAGEDGKQPAEKLLGKKPDILLHGSGNWSKGKNTGSSGIDPDGNLIPAGQFVPTGGIPGYKPDPSLHGAQSPTPPTVRLTREDAIAGL